MKDLIEALTIFLQYGEVAYPTHCEHDILHVYPAAELSAISEAHLARLEELSFHPDTDSGEGFYSFRFGSC